MKHFIKYIFLCAVILFSGCTVKEQVRVDIDKFTRDQASYVDEDVIITATLEDVVSRYDLYRGKKIELSAPFSSYGTKGFWTWYVMLQKGENTLRCYTHYYRLRPDSSAINLLKRAEYKKGSIKILGFLYQDGLDIKEIYHDGISVRPDVFIRRGYYLGW
jgi:hypothetical protein